MLMIKIKKRCGEAYNVIAQNIKEKLKSTM
jgi:hypothetical protein